MNYNINKPKFNKQDLVYVSNDINLFKDRSMQYFDKGFYAIPARIALVQDHFEYMLLQLDNDFMYIGTSGWYHEDQLSLIKHNVKLGPVDIKTGKSISPINIKNL